MSSLITFGMGPKSDLITDGMGRPLIIMFKRIFNFISKITLIVEINGKHNS